MQWGWNDLINASYTNEVILQNHKIARVISEGQDTFRVLIPELDLEAIAKVSGKLRFHNELFPIVGDWIIVSNPTNSNLKNDRTLIDELLILKTLPRYSVLQRKGFENEIHFMASNFDEVWIVTGALNDLNENRIERSLALIANSGAQSRGSSALDSGPVTLHPKGTDGHGPSLQTHLVDDLENSGSHQLGTLELDVMAAVRNGEMRRIGEKRRQIGLGPRPCGFQLVDRETRGVALESERLALGEHFIRHVRKRGGAGGVAEYIGRLRKVDRLIGGVIGKEVRNCRGVFHVGSKRFSG